MKGTGETIDEGKGDQTATCRVSSRRPEESRTRGAPLTARGTAGASLTQSLLDKIPWPTAYLTKFMKTGITEVYVHKNMD